MKEVKIAECLIMQFSVFSSLYPYGRKVRPSQMFSISFSPS